MRRLPWFYCPACLAETLPSWSTALAWFVCPSCGTPLERRSKHRWPLGIKRERYETWHAQ